MEKSATLKCIEYILSTETDDFHEYCASESLDSNSNDIEHIFAIARKAYTELTGIDLLNEE